MRQDLSLIRRLEKIEKEMGYCQIKLEKEQRLAVQEQFLAMHQSDLEQAISNYERDVVEHEIHGNRLGGLDFREVQTEVGTAVRPAEVDRLRGLFRSVGLLTSLRGERDLLQRELEEITEKLTTFSVFHDKKQGLEQERRSAMRGFQLSGREEVLRISAEFEETEQSWNVLTEDLMNFDEALFHVRAVVDYLNSARNFILSSRSQFSVEEWIHRGYLIDLFKHSTVGRAREMIEGADRNLKMALRELLCLQGYEVSLADFEQLLLPFIDQLFEDLFLEGRLSSILKFVERRLSLAEALRKDLEERREAVFAAQTETEETRERLFQQIGDERRKLSLAPPI